VIHPELYLKNCIYLLGNVDLKLANHKIQGIIMNPFEKMNQKEIERINRIQRNLFTKLYHLFDPPLPEGVPKRLKKIVAAAEISKGEVILDVGSGTGILVPYIQKYEPGHIYACDLSKKMLRQLKKHSKYCRQGGCLYEYCQNDETSGADGN
jgi:ubiquinone/menaquinone biosynthesis C-methylase UbiE